VVFCAPKGSYSSSGASGQQKLEFKEMVRALHKAGIEVILDVVFNHTAEGDELGPTLSFRGMDNAIFYTLADDKRYYKDFTGTGNTINANHPVVRDHILNSLRYWVVEMHVDGFRFDLASVLSRDGTGKLLTNGLLATANGLIGGGLPSTARCQRRGDGGKAKRPSAVASRALTPSPRRWRSAFMRACREHARLNGRPRHTAERGRASHLFSGLYPFETARSHVTSHRLGI
jgi:hypothetical protein